MPPRKAAPPLELSDAEYELESSEEDEEEYEEKPSVRSSEIGKILGKKALKAPRHEKLNLRQLYELISDEHVNLDPVYQRDVVWPISRQEALIQSLFFNYYVPPVLFAIDWDDNQEELRVCIDGKQRCSSIMNFMNGVISFRGADKVRYYYKIPSDARKRTGQLLPPALRRQFDMKNLFTVEYENLTLEQQRDIFQRVQLGMPLSVAEKLQALPGPRSEFVASLAKRYVTEDNKLGDLLPNLSVRRSEPFRTLCAFVIRAEKPDIKVSPSQSTMRPYLSRPGAHDPAFIHKIELSMTILMRIASEYYDIAFGQERARVAPIELDMSAFLIFQRMDVMSITRLAAEIARMRAFARKHVQEIRSNKQTTMVFYDYLESVPTSKLPGEVTALQQCDPNPGNKKRRRDGEEEHSEAQVDSSSISTKKRKSPVKPSAGNVISPPPPPYVPTFDTHYVPLPNIDMDAPLRPRR